jgi:hypothetical protein
MQQPPRLAITERNRGTFNLPAAARKRVPHPIAYFAIGWESTVFPKVVILSEVTGGNAVEGSAFPQPKHEPKPTQITCQEQQTKSSSISLILSIKNNP